MTYIPPTYIRPAIVDSRRHDPYVKFHCHCNTSTDSSLYANTMNFSGNATIDTSTPKFGTGCFSLDGNSNSRFFVQDINRQINYSNQDFTIELWLKIPQQVEDKPILCTTTNADMQGWALVTIGTGTTFTVRFYYTKNNITGVWNTFVSNSSLSVNNWHHIAICRNNNYLVMFLNGVMQSNYNELLSTDTITSAANLQIGWYEFWSGSPKTINGKIDEIRITSGYNWYSAGNFNDNGLITQASFPVPTTAFPDSAFPSSEIAGELRSDNYNAISIKNSTTKTWTTIDDMGFNLRNIRG